MRWLAFVLVALVLASCTQGGEREPTPRTVQASTSSPTGAVLARYDVRPLSFRYPSDWMAKDFVVMSSFSSSLVYLSNQPMSDPCVRRSSSTSESITCSAWPIEALQPGGVALKWTANGFLKWNLADQPGRYIEVDGRDAKLSTDGEVCARIGADRGISVVISRKPENNWYHLDGCFRDPGAADAVAEVLALFRSVRISGS